MFNIRRMEVAMLYQGFIKIIRNNFTAGVIFIIPIWITILMIKALAKVLDDFFALFPAGSKLLSSLNFPGAKVLITLVSVLALGFLVNNLIGKKIIKLSDTLISKLPVVRTIYQAVRHLTTGIVGDRKIFTQAVQIEYPIKGLHFIGFVTGEEFQDPKQEEKKILKVFIPTTPNPTSGFFCYANENAVKKMNISIEDAFKLVISAGVADSHK
jgi:uncharacterized membrane protein